MDELISRQAAMEMLMNQNVIMDGSEYHNGFNAGVNRAQEVIRNLSPVQSDVSDIYAGELISRRAATTIPVMPKEHRHYQTNNLDDAYEQGWTDLQECIENLPPVQPKRGKWEYHSNPNIGINPESAYCSCCGFYVDTTGNIDFDEYNFCPCCGADMRGGKDGTD